MGIDTPSGETYSQEDVFAMAKPIGGDWRKAHVYLDEGESAWYPGSAKKEYVGPGWITYMLHPSSIESHGHIGYAATLRYKR